MTEHSRLSAPERLERLLAIIPWVAARDGAPIDEIAERFDYPKRYLLNDLEEVVFLVGLYPFSPDQLIEVRVEDDLVWIRYAEYFERPLRLSADEAFALVTGGQSLLAAPGADDDGPLARGLRKLAVSLGFGDDSPVDVRLGGVDADVVTSLRTACERHLRVDLDYYAFGRDERTERRVDPYRVFVEDGHWYLLAHCHLADGERIFRVDRIDGAVVTDETFDPPDLPVEHSVFEPRPDDPRVVLDLAADASWVAEHYPSDAAELRPDGTSRVTLAVTAVPWLERLLLRLGPSAKVVSASGDLPGDISEAAARRVLRRYRAS